MEVKRPRVSFDPDVNRFALWSLIGGELGTNNTNPKERPIVLINYSYNYMLKIQDRAKQNKVFN